MEFSLAFLTDEGHKGQNLVSTTKMLWKIKIQTQYTNIKEFIKEGPLEIGSSFLTFEGNEGQNKG